MDTGPTGLQNRVGAFFLLVRAWGWLLLGVLCLGGLCGYMAACCIATVCVSITHPPLKSQQPPRPNQVMICHVQSITPQKYPHNHHAPDLTR